MPIQTRKWIWTSGESLLCWDHRVDGQHHALWLLSPSLTERVSPPRGTRPTHFPSTARGAQGVPSSSRHPGTFPVSIRGVGRDTSAAHRGAEGGWERPSGTASFPEEAWQCSVYVVPRLAPLPGHLDYGRKTGSSFCTRAQAGFCEETESVDSDLSQAVSCFDSIHCVGFC
jgi:hypothetical protein